MKSMAYTREELKDRNDDVAEVENEGEMYPWGLCIDLNDESLKKLGITQLPQVGATYMLTASVKVKTTHQSRSADDKDRSSMELQITDMALAERGGPSKSEQADKLYN